MGEDGNRREQFARSRIVRFVREGRWWSLMLAGWVLAFATETIVVTALVATQVPPQIGRFIYAIAIGIGLCGGGLVVLGSFRCFPIWKRNDFTMLVSLLIAGFQLGAGGLVWITWAFILVLLVGGRI